MTTTAPLPAAAPPIGAVLRHVPEGETLVGWPIVATGDGREVACAPSGSCLHRYDGTVPIDLAWNAMSAYLRARA